MKKLFLVAKKPAPPKSYPTTVQLTMEQRLAIHGLQIQRMIQERGKPTMTEVVSEALDLLFKKDEIKKIHKLIFPEDL